MFFQLCDTVDRQEHGDRQTEMVRQSEGLGSWETERGMGREGKWDIGVLGRGSYVGWHQNISYSYSSKKTHRTVSMGVNYRLQ